MFLKENNRELGEVIEVNGDIATVRIGANKNCEKCGLCKKVSPTEMVLQAYIEGNVTEGDRVFVNFRPGTVVKSAFILYILPLFGLISGYFTGRGLGLLFRFEIKGELLPALTSLMFLFLTFIPVKIYDRKKQKDHRFKPFVTPERTI